MVKSNGAKEQGRLVGRGKLLKRAGKSGSDDGSDGLGSGKIDTESSIEEIKKENSEENNEEEYNEEEDEDYDPNGKVEDEKGASDSNSEEEDEKPDFSVLEGGEERIVKTRSQRLNEQQVGGTRRARFRDGLVTNEDLGCRIDVDAVFDDLKKLSKDRGGRDEWRKSVELTPVPEVEINGLLLLLQLKQQQNGSHEPQKIKIESVYSFAGRLVTESKLVDANSAEAKAYLNSTKGIAIQNRISSSLKPYSLFVPVLRTVPGTSELTELRIKLKRPSLIDKFLSTNGGKKLKLSTLEKSRLDWASFVDKTKIQDELKLHNKAGYLDKQEFLGRLQYKQDEKFQQARQDERARQWKLQQENP